MDNLFFNIVAKDNSALASAISIAWTGAPGGASTHYVEVERDGIKTLVLFWHEDRDAIKLPFPLFSEAKAFEFVQGWLASTDRPSEPDHDGDNGYGFRIFVDSWGRVAPYTYSFMAVQFAWAKYGK